MATFFFGDVFFAVFFLAVFFTAFFFAGFLLTDVRAFLAAFFFAGLLGVIFGRDAVPEDASPPIAAESQKRNSGDFSSGAEDVALLPRVVWLQRLAEDLRMLP